MKNNTIVTGSSSGIGKELVKLLLKKGNYVLGIDIKDIDMGTSKYNHIITDLSNPEQVINDLNEIDLFPNYSGLVNVAGITIPTRDNDDIYAKLKKFEKTAKVNLYAPFILSELFFRSRKKPYIESSIVNVSSIGAFQGFPGNPSYCSSKGGLEALTRSMALDYQQKNIRVNCIRPGYTETPMNKKSLDDPILKEKRSNQTVMGRWAKPYEIAESIEYFLSQKSSYITGTTLTVDGGWIIKGMV